MKEGKGGQDKKKEGRRQASPTCSESTLTPSLIRTSVLLTFACLYIMWSVTYLAQMNPLIGELWARSGWHGVGGRLECCQTLARR